MERSDADLWGAITALNHLLEHSWAFTLVALGGDEAQAAARRIRPTIMRDFDLPQPPKDRTESAFVVSQHAVSFLEEFWDRVELRVRKEGTAEP